MNIYQKLVEVRKSIKGFSKDTKGFGFEYVSGNQILRAIKDKMDELGILLIPSINYDSFNWEKHEYKNKKGEDKLDFVVQSQMSYKWINADEPTDFIEIPWIMVGQQGDDISKAVGTAMTYNERYFLLKQFGLPTDEDDADKKEPNYGGKSSNYKNKTNELSEAQIKRLYAIANNKGITPQQVVTACKRDYNVLDVKKLNKKQYDELCEKMEAVK